MSKHLWWTSHNKGKNFSFLGIDILKAAAIGAAESDKVLPAKDRRPEFRSSAPMYKLNSTTPLSTGLSGETGRPHGSLVSLSH